MQAAAYPARAQDVIWRNIAGEVVIVQDDGMTVRMLNKAGSAIWLLADGTTSVDAIAAALVQRFDVGVDRALSDVSAFCEQLSAAKLLTL